MEHITIVGIDLAKQNFQVHGVDERGKAVLRKQLRRNQMAVFLANLPRRASLALFSPKGSSISPSGCRIFSKTAKTICRPLFERC